MLSNGVTNIDSVTKFEEYIDQAKKCGMTALAFTEHGSVFNWWHKKCAIETAGMKYIHACEMYVTESLIEKVRDNYHCVLIAKNTEGLKELNRLISGSFNRNDNHFYYVPRISFDELISTSENIIITTACLGGILHNGTDDAKERFLHFLLANKNRCFLEIQHHRVFDQIEYNQYLYKLNQQYHLRLVAGTDTHALNEKRLYHYGGTAVRIRKKDSFF
jgi:DNA polymerase-3 subunit alpha